MDISQKEVIEIHIKVYAEGNCFISAAGK